MGIPYVALIYCVVLKFLSYLNFAAALFSSRKSTCAFNGSPVLFVVLLVETLVSTSHCRNHVAANEATARLFFRSSRSMVEQ
ncbi:hypothetical protein PanWU01x14_247000, partial [Parasponia andersonii]